MPAKPSKPRVPPPVIPAEDAQRLLKFLDDAIVKYEGQFDELENAVGMYLVGRLVGWKPLVLIHNKRTIKKYEEVLGIKIREAFPEKGAYAQKSAALLITEKLGNFWKVVSGDLKTEELTEKRRQLT